MAKQTYKPQLFGGISFPTLKIKYMKPKLGTWDLGASHSIKCKSKAVLVLLTGIKCCYLHVSHKLTIRVWQLMKEKKQCSTFVSRL